jgi:hypothetical protein
VPQENQGAHTWNVRPQAPTPAASLKIQRLIPEGSAEALAGQTALFFVALTCLELTFDCLAVDRVGPLLAALSPVEDKVWSDLMAVAVFSGWSGGLRVCLHL